METYKEVLNDIEKSKIIAFNNDPVMKEAVKKILLAGLYENGTLKPGESADPLKNFALTRVFKSYITGIPVTNEELGADLRASAVGIKLLEGGFDEIAKFKEETPKEAEKENPAL